MASYYYQQPQGGYVNELDLNSLLNLLHQEQFNQHRNQIPHHYYNHRPQHRQQHQQQQQQHQHQKQQRAQQPLIHYYSPRPSQLQIQPYKQQQPSARPRVVKKLETEDEYQIQIYKPYGNFNNYEVQVVKAQPPLIKIVISAPADNFKISNTFNLNYIDIENINWRWYKSENILCLNIPKKLHYIHSSIEDIFNCLFGGSGITDDDANAVANADEDADEDEYEYEEPVELHLLEDAKGDSKQNDEVESGNLEEYERLLQEAAEALKQKKQKKKQQRQQKDKSGVANGSHPGFSKLEQDEEDRLEDHEKLLEDAANALKQKKDKNNKPDAAVATSSDVSAEDKKAKELEYKAAEEAAALARKKQEVEEKNALKENKALEGNKSLEEKKREFAQKQKETEERIKQAQLELERLVKQQEELEKESGNRKDGLKQVEAKAEADQEQEQDQDQEKPSTQKKEQLAIKDENKQRQIDEIRKQQQLQQQELLNQFFGFNLGPVLTDCLPKPQDNSIKQTKKKQVQEIATNLVPKEETGTTTSMLKSNSKENESKTPNVKQSLKDTARANSGKIKRRESPLLEDVEDEESVLWRKKFDH
ncbi:hypothetical protein KGF56_002061 [Candida oxycetoniae]|uniref:Uncharacterized protein n=1 Tax=Candida oxycetoniae TaxID=497107 RepID=A0AAI9WYJ5_9ASCO|nr:uncharacterized protein KGF56_002061 [Candida oxycetoniae]KAI3405105.2 hypothetical protein KGF56_002061 [Candida oxycetoniae]